MLPMQFTFYEKNIHSQLALHFPGGIVKKGHESKKSNVLNSDTPLQLILWLNMRIFAGPHICHCAFVVQSDPGGQ